MRILAENIGKEQDKYLNSLENPIWLTEEKLGKILKELYKNDEIIYNKKMGLPFRPDYQIPSLKICFEFNGYHHFNNSQTIYKDYMKNEWCISNNWKRIEIPYFLQLNKDILSFYNLNNSNDFSENFPCGFIHPKALLPGNFCYHGNERFNKIFHKLPENIKFEIFNSIFHRAEMLKIPIKFLTWEEKYEGVSLNLNNFC